MEPCLITGKISDYTQGTNIGGELTAGAWRWNGLHSGPLTATDWRSGEPTPDEDCIEFGVAGWNNVKCSTKHSYARERAV